MLVCSDFTRAGCAMVSRQKTNSIGGVLHVTTNLRRPALALCWISIVCGVILFIAGAYTGYVEGVEADEAGTVGQLMPAELLAFILGPVLAISGVVVAVLVRAGSKAPAASS